MNKKTPNPDQKRAALDTLIDLLDHLKYLDNYALVNKSKFIRAEIKEKIANLEGFINIIDKILTKIEQKKEDIVYSSRSYSQDEDFMKSFNKKLEKKQKQRRKNFGRYSSLQNLKKLSGENKKRFKISIFSPYIF